jgi:hypothetical protein
MHYWRHLNHITIWQSLIRYLGPQEERSAIMSTSSKNRSASIRNKHEAPDERHALIERLREFIRFGYATGSEVARRIGGHDGRFILESWASFDQRTRND